MINIGNRCIGPQHVPFVIAEMSGNHNQSLDRALEIVEAAADAGVDAIKLQTYTADTMTLNLAEGDFFIDDPNSLWKGQSLYSLYEKAHTPWEWHEPIFRRAIELGLIAFSTPFDETAVDFLESLNVPCYKIASFENTDIPLISKIAATGKPIMMSTGMASIGELDESVRAARSGGCKDIALLKCSSTYPAPPEHSNLRTIPHMRELFECEVGLSDHTIGIGTAIAAVTLGATIVEKHFTIDGEDEGVDSVFSIKPYEMKRLVQEVKSAWQALGQIRYGPTEAEKASIMRRRSLYVADDIEIGDKFTSQNLRRIRPGQGLPPKYYNVLIGKEVRRPAEKGTPVTWDLF